MFRSSGETVRPFRRLALGICVSLTLAVTVQGAAIASTTPIIYHQFKDAQVVSATGVSTSADGCTRTETNVEAFRENDSLSGPFSYAEYWWSSMNSCTGEPGGGYGRTFADGPFPGVLTVSKDSARLVVDIGTSDGYTVHLDETWSPTGPPVTKTFIYNYSRDTYTSNYRYTGRVRPATVTGSGLLSSGFFGTTRSGEIFVGH
jgi:hypothetical protein